MTSEAQPATAAQWSLPREAGMPDDPLTRCLEILTRIFHQPFNASTLTAGLPLVNSRLTPELFPRAASRAGFSARVVPRRLEQISALTLPCVLLLKDSRACVAVGRKGDEWTIVTTEAGTGEHTVSTAALAEDYTNFAIFVRPSFRFDRRVDDYAVPRGQDWFWHAIKHAWPLYSEMLIASFLINCFALVAPLFSMNVYDRVVPNQVYETLWVLAIGVFLIYVFDVIMKNLRSYFLDTAGKQVEVILSSTIMEKVLGLRPAVRPQSVGGLAQNLAEFESFREFITSGTISTLIDLPFVILFLAVIAWIGGPVALVPIAVIPLIVITGLVLQRPLRSLIGRVMAISSQRQAVLIEALTGIDTIKAIGAEGHYQHRWEQIVGEIGRTSIKAKLLSSAVINQAGFFQQLAYIGVIIVGIYQIADGKLTMGGLIACAMLTGRTTGPFSQIAALITRYYQATHGLKGIDKMMQLPVERPPGKSFVQRDHFHGDIELRNVSFSYPGQAVPALANVSFSIKAGERVGLIGRIGSGKTTIEKLLLGLYQPDEGSVWIDGVDLQQIDPADLRHNIGHVPQDVFLFHGSVRQNITLGAPYAADGVMLAAAEAAGVTEFVNRHPAGFDMPVGERGEGLSGGQRQAVAIARALLLAPPILLLDEPTNSLDNRSEENFKARLAKNLNGRTLVVVTHRSSLLTLVDRLIVMDGGRIIADGPKAKVLEALSGGKLHATRN